MVVVTSAGGAFALGLAGAGNNSLDSLDFIPVQRKRA